MAARSAVHLEPIQLYSRLISPPGKPVSPGHTSALPLWNGLPAVPDVFRKCHTYGQDAEKIAAGRFNFLNSERTFPQKLDWNPASTERLWRYHLHYFDWALALALDGSPRCLSALDQRITEWLEATPPGNGTGWEPYPLSLRIVNLAHILSIAGALSDATAEKARASLALQARALTRGIEKALQGNHLIKNGKALLTAGLAFQGKEAEDWFRRGMELLKSEMESQVRQDGGHADRCSMYQAQVLLDYLESIALLKAAGREFPFAWNIRLESMCIYLEAMFHPDGLPTLFGDTSMSCVPPKNLWLKCAQAASISPEFLDDCAGIEFPETSYAVARNLARGNYLILDCGTTGDALEAAHYHCQIFAYEFSFAGRRVATDTGISTYEIGPQRAYCRSSLAHNTVSWRNHEQAEIWDSFRLARRAHILDREVKFGAPGVLQFTGQMRGFYPGRNRGSWERRLVWMPEGRISVCDTWLAPQANRDMVSRIHFAPDLKLAPAGDGSWEVREACGHQIASLRIRKGSSTLTKSPYHASFGKGCERQCVELMFVDNSVHYEIQAES
jgi:uncharacterized heparinase superfamily protein